MQTQPPILLLPSTTLAQTLTKSQLAIQKLQRDNEVG
jgi:hypothetical protein